MKKVIIFMMVLIGFVSFSLAANQPNVWESMTQQNVGSFYPIESCFDGQTVYQTQNYYVWDDFNIYDTHWGDSNNYAYIYDRSTKVFVVDPYNVFDFDDSFKFKSNGKPVWTYKVKFVENNGNFLPGTLLNNAPDVNNWELVAQIAFNLHRQWFHTSWWPADYNIGYWPMPNGPQSTSSFNNYHVWNYKDGLECYNYVVHYCGDGDVDTAQSISMLEWWNQNSVANEQCDPADSSHEGWGNQWCSNTCEPIDETIDPPTCTLWYTSIGNDQFLIYWNIVWNFYTPSSINITPNTLVQSSYSVLENQGQWVWVEPTEPGTYIAHMTVTNQGGSNSCDTTFTLEWSQDPELSLDKILLTTDPVGIWDFVDYEIELTNNGQWVSVDTYLKDEMPASLELVSYNIVWISNFEVNDWQDTNGNWFVEYSNFDLNPGQTATMTLRGKVRNGALAGETTNCAFTIGEVDCEMYSLSNNPYIVKYQKNANASTNTSTLSMDDIVFVNELENMVHNWAQPDDPQVNLNLYTTWDIVVNFGDTIKYRIKFGNNGATYTNGWVRVVDYMPKCVDYVTASIQWVDDANFVQTQDAQWRQILEYNWFDLGAGQQGYMLVEWKIMNTSECQSVNTYINNSYIYFANPLRVETSNTTAVRVDWVANVYKNSTENVNMLGDDKIFNIWVTNNTPNPITDLILEDIWPSGPCIEYVDRSGNGFEKDNGSLTWTYAWPLAAWKSTIMYIDAHILNDASCVNPDYVNVVNLTYTEAWSEKYDEAEYHFEVIGTPVANVSLVKTADKTVVSSGDDITYTIVYQNNGTVALDSYVLTDIWPAMVDFQTANPFPNSIVSFVTGDVLKWIFNTPLLPGEGWEIILEWIVK